MLFACRRTVIMPGVGTIEVGILPGMRRSPESRYDYGGDEDLVIAIDALGHRDCRNAAVIAEVARCEKELWSKSYIKSCKITRQHELIANEFCALTREVLLNGEPSLMDVTPVFELLSAAGTRTMVRWGGRRFVDLDRAEAYR